VGLFAVAFIKIIAKLVALPGSGIGLSCFLALAYSASYLILELMTWALAAPSSRNALKNVPFENLPEVVKLVDPGDNPFTFPPRALTNGSPPVLSMPRFASNGPSGSTQGIAATGTVDSRAPWNRLVAAVVASLGFVCPLFWMLILSHIWSPTRGALILTTTAIAFAVLRTKWKWLYRKFRQQLHERNSNFPARQASDQQAGVEAPSPAPGSQSRVHRLGVGMGISRSPLGVRKSGTSRGGAHRDSPRRRNSLDRCHRCF
jgi:hypothetical protein